MKGFFSCRISNYEGAGVSKSAKLLLLFSNPQKDESSAKLKNLLRLSREKG